MFETADMEAQGQILSAIANLVDAGEVRTTLTERFSPINAANLKCVHETLESTTARGKIVVEGWE
jgi:NADPH:quinone reductase-like Zn-dependent oxidoreductase